MINYILSALGLSLTNILTIDRVIIFCGNKNRPKLAIAFKIT